MDVREQPNFDHSFHNVTPSRHNYLSVQRDYRHFSTLGTGISRPDCRKKVARFCFLRPLSCVGCWWPRQLSVLQQNSGTGFTFSVELLQQWYVCRILWGQGEARRTHRRQPEATSHSSACPDPYHTCRLLQWMLLDIKRGADYMEITAHTCSICHRTSQWDSQNSCLVCHRPHISFRRGSRQYPTNIFMLSVVPPGKFWDNGITP